MQGAEKGVAEHKGPVSVYEEQRSPSQIPSHAYGQVINDPSLEKRGLFCKSLSGLQPPVKAVEGIQRQTPTPLLLLDSKKWERPFIPQRKVWAHWHPHPPQ